jgi:hypothetical protein
MRARSLLLALLLPLCVAAPGCEQSRDPKTVEGALTLLAEKAAAHDAAWLYENASARTRELTEQLHAELVAQKGVIDKKYDGAQKEAAKVAYPDELLAAEDPPALFAHLVKKELGGLDPADEGYIFGQRAAGSATIDGEKATIANQAGEQIPFVLEGGVWRTSAFEERLERNLGWAKENRKTLDKNLEVIAELERRAKAKAAKAAAEAPAEGEAPAPR